MYMCNHGKNLFNASYHYDVNLNRWKKKCLLFVMYRKIYWTFIYYWKKLCYYTMDLQFHKFFYPDTVPIPELSILHFQKLWFYDKKLKTVVDWFYHRKLLLTSFSMRFQTFYHYVLSICWFLHDNYIVMFKIRKLYKNIFACWFYLHVIFIRVFMWWGLVEEMCRNESP